MANLIVDPILMLRRIQAHQSYIKPILNINANNSKGSVMKPPNILVYQPKSIQNCPKDCLTVAVERCLPLDKFAVYRLRYEEAASAPWMDNCQLLVVPSTASKNVDLDESEIVLLEKYLSLHGKILSFSSEVAKYFKFQTRDIEPVDKCCFIDKFNKPFSEAPVLEFCGRVFQSSDSFQSASNSVVLSSKFNDSQLDPVAIISVRNGGKILHCSLPLLTCCDSGKHCCQDCSVDENSKVLLNYFFRELDIATMSELNMSIPKETPCVILSENPDELSAFFKDLDIVHPESCVLKGTSTSLKFMQVQGFTSELMQSLVSSNTTNPFVPVLHCPNPESASNSINFDWIKFQQNLKTKRFAKTIIYSDVVTSTMDIVEPFTGKMLHKNDITVTCISKQQTQGKGRGGNKWLSPIGTAMFSHVLSVSKWSNLGQRMSVLQHLTTVSVVHALRSIPELVNLDLRVKWPNDIYIGRDIKIGGVLVKSTMFNNNLITTIGCGVNVSNDFPTKCINDAIRIANIPYSPLTCEEVLARTLSCLEDMINSYQVNGADEFLKLYYKYWIHSNQEIQISHPSNKVFTKGVIVGIDSSGFLCADLHDGKRISLQPDSNSFDMTKNLIAMKSTH
ncbi:biotin--protein ligase-like [Styela clava]